MTRRPAFPWLLGTAVVLLFLGPALVPGRTLAAFDLTFLHLPYRTSFSHLAHLARALPTWNPFVQGGQPILSNPHYAAAYPPTWLGVLLPTIWATGLLAGAHAALAFAGAWRLVRSLGGGRFGAALAAIGFVGGGAGVGLIHTFNLFTAMAWMPWVLLGGLALLAETSPPRRLLLALGTGAAIACQLLAGSPDTALLSALALAAVVPSAPDPRRALPPVATAIALALLLASPQLLPTAAHLGDSPRAGGFDLETATERSTPSARALELLLPHALGDPTRDEEGLYFGWGIHDRDYPLLVVVYPGLLFTVLGLAGLGRPGSRWRPTWGLLAGTGTVLALGRHTPVYPLLHALLPPLRGLRYPEKFLLLTLVSLVFAGALEADRLAHGEPDRRRATSVAGAVLAMLIALAVATHLAPERVAELVAAHSGLPPSPEALARAIRYLRQETLIGLLAGALVFAFVRLAGRWGARGRRLLPLVVALVAADLWLATHRAAPTLPVAELARPPALARDLAGTGTRLFSTALVDDRPEIHLRLGEPGFQQLRTRIARADPAVGALWHIAYVLDEEIDLMRTGWADHALGLLEASWANDRGGAEGLLDAWSAAYLVVRLSPEELLAEMRRRGPDAGPPPPARLEPNPDHLPPIRFVAEVTRHATVEQAVEAARGQGFELRRHDHWIGPGEVPRSLATSPPRLLAVDDRGGLLEIEYEADQMAMLVVAQTFHQGWEASVDGVALETSPTAIGQIGIAVPAGRHTLVLQHREPWFGAGLGIAITTLLASLLIASRMRETKHGPGSERTLDESRSPPSAADRRTGGATPG